MAERAHRIALVPGDGIGPEVVDQAVKVLHAVGSAEGISYETVQFDLGAKRYLATGETLPDSELEHLTQMDAVLLGAVGDPRVSPGILENGILLRLRRELDLFVNLRPARLLPGVRTVLRDHSEDLDFLIVRENTEGLYSGLGEVRNQGTIDEAATEVSLNTRSAIERILEYAFALAEESGRSLTLVHKTNVLEWAGGLYWRVFEEFASNYPSVATHYQHIDAAAMLMVTDPSRFGVIVTDNLFGDILSDLAAGLTGGIGFAASGNIHPGRVSMFEPVHGSAPDIAGTGRANPIGAILSAALMLRHLGEETAGDRIEKAVERGASSATRGFETRRVGELIAESV